MSFPELRFEKNWFVQDGAIDITGFPEREPSGFLPELSLYQNNIFHNFQSYTAHTHAQTRSDPVLVQHVLCVYFSYKKCIEMLRPKWFSTVVPSLQFR